MIKINNLILTVNTHINPEKNMMKNLINIVNRYQK